MRVNPITFTANIVVQSMCEELGYNDRIVVNGLAGSPIYQGAISIYPNPFKIVDSPDEGKGATKEMPYWAVGFGVIKDGTYFAYCNISPKHGKCFYLKDPILCKGRSTYSVPCRNRQTPMINCEIHSGGLNPDSPTGFGINPNWRGSTGCLTIPPTDWINFIRLFNNGDKLQITI